MEQFANAVEHFAKRPEQFAEQLAKGLEQLAKTPEQLAHFAVVDVRRYLGSFGLGIFAISDLWILEFWEFGMCAERHSLCARKKGRETAKQLPSTWWRLAISGRPCNRNLPVS